MSVIEKLAVISDTITKLMNFVSTNDVVKPDFEEYIKTVSSNNQGNVKIQALIIPYIFERRLTKERKTIYQRRKMKS